MSHRVIFLWTVPRSVSTSFERMMGARGGYRRFAADAIGADRPE